MVKTRSGKDTYLRESSDYSTYDINEQQNRWGKQACQRSVGAFFEVIVDIVGAVSYSNTHVKAVGEDKADTAVPVGQEIRDAQKREGQGQHNKIVPRKKTAQQCIQFRYLLTLPLKKYHNLFSKIRNRNSLTIF